MNIKEKLTCTYCNEIYKDPTTLSCCGNNICKRHVEELMSNNSSNKFMCPICNKENCNQNSNVNKLIQNFIEIEIHKFELDPKYEQIFNNLKMEIKKFEAILKDPEHVIYEEISELKRQVDLDREKLKNEIDELADGLIQQLESYEKRFKAEYKANIDFEYYNGLVESSRKQLDEYEKCLSLFSTKNQEKDEKCNECEKTIKVLQPSIIETKEKLFSNLSIVYNPMENNIKDGFGKLIIKVILFASENLTY